jgi:hypothetical protein
MGIVLDLRWRTDIQRGKQLEGWRALRRLLKISANDRKGCVGLMLYRNSAGICESADGTRALR